MTTSDKDENNKPEAASPAADRAANIGYSKTDPGIDDVGECLRFASRAAIRSALRVQGRVRRSHFFCFPVFNIS